MKSLILISNNSPREDIDLSCYKSLYIRRLLRSYEISITIKYRCSVSVNIFDVELIDVVTYYTVFSN